VVILLASFIELRKMTSFKNFNKLQKDSWKFTVEIQVFWEDLVRAPD